MQAENVRVAEEERRKTLVEETKHSRAVGGKENKFLNIYFPESRVPRPTGTQTPRGGDGLEGPAAGGVVEEAGGVGQEAGSHSERFAKKF